LILVLLIFHCWMAIQIPILATIGVKSAVETSIQSLSHATDSAKADPEKTSNKTAMYLFIQQSL
jgi:hypothetical protein